ncbi:MULTISPECIES: hypothetical protein [Myxococcus]|uniref:Uncharacterized protein n=1 Tax=Myxococcus llanfairpwllgwyngyllgogerychwyrndrobwllllantysiliogogogochensis TaxID=2590453 RepID=A0A540X4Q8_9BACT|nr:MULTISPECIES: hypothetical protein [Myxococcus]NTX07301.1 hypothetical protein [Myxococcus sp. CA040A]TQF16235.1 hypothetical protein FJV41_09485 [Myxococcus llanfairpwllgwyngyllgogerychwyrndrobwllllantysiliogogogochensis]
MFTENKELEWSEVPFEDASAKYTLNGISEDGLGEVFFEDPAHYLVHEGDVVIDGPVSFGAADDGDVTLHVIDGNLTVNGPLFFIQGDFNGALLVTGSIFCQNAIVGVDAMLYVGKSMHVEGLLVTTLSKPSHFAIREALIAGSWLEATGNGLFEIGQKPQARLLRVGKGSYRAFSRYGEEEEKRARDEGKEVKKPSYFGFSPKEASSVQGILHPSLLEGEEDISAGEIREAMEEGRPLFA